MSNRTAMFASGVIAGCVAIFTIITVPAIAEPTAEPAAADECLAAPKATTPAGAHWYYRVEKGTKRKCWYLSDAGGKVKATAKPTPVVEQEKPASDKPMRKSVANARAELTVNSSGDDPSLAETTWPPLTPSADAATGDDKQGAAIQAAPATANSSGIASRWLEPTIVASAERQSTTGAATTSAPAPTQPAPALTPDRLAAAAAAVTPAPVATPAAAPHPVTAAETADSEGFSIRVLLALLVCALALVAIIGPMIFKYVRPRRREEQRAPAQRRPIWDMDLSSDTIRQDNPRMPSPMLYSDAPPEPRVLDETVDELEILLARASRRSAA